ncbi:3'-5' exonuclease [Saccharicrinis sp. FJH54]|uniref:3'-5' exonuclease n=1 Tax=Saccharicrinis sp. FJH54 TaxID=3344665 RepID=UPI0035D50C94
MTYPESITKEELSSLPLCGFEGNVVVVDDNYQIKQALEHLQRHNIIGFDSETKPSFKKGVINDVSLIQLSTHNTCYLFRLNMTGLTDELRQLMEDEHITKIGLSLRDDIRGLRRLADIKPKGFIDLQEKVAEYGIDDRSLKKITGIVLNKRISKKQRLTNWESTTLTEAQQRYAATDAWICLEIYKELISTEKYEELR